jgi:MFS family permease
MMAMVRPQQPTMAMIPRPLMLAMVYSSLSGLLSGYQMGIAGGALNSLQSSSLDITSSQAGHITSIYFIGLMVAGPFGGYATDKFGRRTCILYMDGLLFVGSLLMAVAPNYKTLLAGRFIVGCATAVSLVAAVSYLTELASVNHNHAQHHRGALVLSVQASIALGFLASYLASYALSTTAKDDNEEGVGQWRLLFGVGTGILAGVQWMGMRRMPESPQWLDMKGYYDRAHVAVSRFTTITNPTSHDDSSIIALDEDAISSSMTDAAIEAHVLGRLDQTMAYGEAIRTNAAAIPTFSQYWRQAVM